MNLRLATPKLAAAFAVASFLGGCNLHQDGVRAPDNRIAFPSGAIVAPGGRFMFVVNSNSDLRYATGTIAVVDLDAVRRDDPRSVEALSPGAASAPPPEWPVCPSEPRYVPPAGAPHGCCWDYLDRSILVCDEQAYIRRERTIRIGSFAGRPVWQKVKAEPDEPGRKGTVVGHRLILPVRGDNSITVVGVTQICNGAPCLEDESGKSQRPDDVSLSCTGPRPGPNANQATFAECDDNWKVTRLRDPATGPLAIEVPDNEIPRLPDEPYALAVDDDLALLYVGHLRGGIVSLIDLGRGADSVQTPELVDRNFGVVPPDGTGAAGVTSIKVSVPGNCSAPVYVGSRFLPIVTSFVPVGLGGLEEACVKPRQSATSTRDIVIVPTGTSLVTGLAGTDVRGIEIMDANPETGRGRRAFVLQRNPPVVVALDLDAGNVSAGTIEVCQGASTLALHEGPEGQMLYVTCFDGGQVYVIDPTVPRLRAIVSVGRGPTNLVFDPTDDKRAYVVGFGANNISVLDLDPSSPRQYHVIQRIGFPSATPREAIRR